MSEKLLEKKFEQTPALMQPDGVALTTAILSKVAMQFSRVERAPRYQDSRRESDVEHSYMLALVAPELAELLELPLDPGLVSQFAIVHDLIELKTNDVPTFLLTEEQLHHKEEMERAALEDLLDELPPHTAGLLLRYERQAEPEARFVRFVDKLLPLIVDILGDGKRVLQEDYGIHDTESLHEAHEAVHERLDKKFGSEFPQVSRAHKELTRIAELLIQFN